MYRGKPRRIINSYITSLVLFSESNNHKQTIIFGFGLVLDESIPSYTWMLQNLLQVMCNKIPSAVLTDENDAMIAVVQRIFPRARHQLCA
ncbi:hypothetical protein Ahy_B03g066054 [Arachis hypogaea]|uniref:MULE transposase domain-containing protein n=1 Tax=Arachis hypogaea TaxID=3818 RepID=A0A445A2Z1_ARAHY|nr:hypothetical protein Ahy_B03g066054 [Arachis hypogaea]